MCSNSPAVKSVYKDLRIKGFYGYSSVFRRIIDDPQNARTTLDQQGIFLPCRPCRPCQTHVPTILGLLTQRYSSHVRPARLPLPVRRSQHQVLLRSVEANSKFYCLRVGTDPAHARCRQQILAVMTLPRGIKKRLTTAKHPYTVYFLTDSGSSRSYIGYTNNLEQRLRKHRKLIKGGARYTRGFTGRVCLVACVHGFENRRAALQYEWTCKRRCRSTSPGRVVLGPTLTSFLAAVDTSHRRFRWFVRTATTRDDETALTFKGISNNSPPSPPPRTSSSGVLRETATYIFRREKTLVDSLFGVNPPVQPTPTTTKSVARTNSSIGI
jgi:predicted GIY-YIG superfamily endonuclease